MLATQAGELQVEAFRDVCRQHDLVQRKVCRACPDDGPNAREIPCHGFGPRGEFIPRVARKLGKSEQIAPDAVGFDLSVVQPVQQRRMGRRIAEVIQCFPGRVKAGAKRLKRGARFYAGLDVQVDKGRCLRALLDLNVIDPDLAGSARRPIDDQVVGGSTVRARRGWEGGEGLADERPVARGLWGDSRRLTRSNRGWWRAGRRT